jgi:hypothetical protein
MFTLEQLRKGHNDAQHVNVINRSWLRCALKPIPWFSIYRNDLLVWKENRT